jgi:branched-chain amino acid transport system substrate-binding protein
MRKFVLAAGALLAAALVAGSPAAPDPIVIGQYGAFTGKDSAFGTSARKGVILAVEEVNAAGGVLGRKLQLVTEDNQSKLGESGTIARKFAARDHVVAVLGGNASADSLEAAPILQGAHVPMIAISSTDEKVTRVGDYIFRVCFIDPFQGAVLAKFAQSHLAARRVAIISSVNNPYAVGLTRVFRQRFTAAGGEIVADQRYSEGDKDFRAQLTAIKAAAPQAVFAAGYYTEGTLICRQARQLGLEVPILGGDGWEAPELLTLGGTAVEGVFFSAHFSKDSTVPEVLQFLSHFRGRWENEDPDGIAANGYDAVKLLVAALQRAGTTDGPALRDAIAATRDFPGVTGKISIDPQRNAAKPAVILTVGNGRFKYVETVTP